MAGDFDGTPLLATVDSGSFGVDGFSIGGIVSAPATPTVTLVSPAEGQIAANDEVVVDITVPAPSNLRLVLLSVAFPLAPLRAAEVIYSSSRGASQPYSHVTTEDISDDENNGVRVRMTRLGGWPATELRFDPDVVTTDGGENP